jgi:hypothetical protein
MIVKLRLRGGVPEGEISSLVKTLILLRENPQMSFIGLISLLLVFALFVVAAFIVFIIVTALTACMGINTSDCVCLH